MEGVSGRSMGSEVLMDERFGRAEKSEEEVLTCSGVSWTGGKVATEGGTVVVEEVMVEGIVVEEAGTAVEAGEMVCVFVEFSNLA